MDLQQLTERTGAICQEVAAFIREEAPRLTEAGVSSKSANNLVTHVDHTAEDRLVDEGLVQDLRGKFSLPQVVGAVARVRASATPVETAYIGPR